MMKIYGLIISRTIIFYQLSYLSKLSDRVIAFKIDEYFLATHHFKEFTLHIVLRKAITVKTVAIEVEAPDTSENDETKLQYKRYQPEDIQAGQQYR